MYCSEFLQFVLKHYGSALRYGNKYIYQCMPRLLSLWLDFGAKVKEEEGIVFVTSPWIYYTHWCYREKAKGESTD